MPDSGLGVVTPVARNQGAAQPLRLGMPAVGSRKTVSTSTGPRYYDHRHSAVRLVTPRLLKICTLCVGSSVFPRRVLAQNISPQLPVSRKPSLLMDLLAPVSESLHLQKRVSGRLSNLKLAAEHRRNKTTLQVFFDKSEKNMGTPFGWAIYKVNLHGISRFACVRRINFQEYSFTLKKNFVTRPSRIQTIWFSVFAG